MKNLILVLSILLIACFDLSAQNGKWVDLNTGRAKEIIAGGTKVFVIGMDDQLYEWNGSTWIRGGVYPKSVAVDKDNSIWIVEKDSNDIKRYKNAKWEKMPGYAKRVFAGGKRVLIIGTDDQMYEWNGSGWTRGGVYPTSIATDHKHYIWITNKDNSIRYIGWE